MIITYEQKKKKPNRLKGLTYTLEDNIDKRKMTIVLVLINKDIAR
jgi:hypothetical protein